MESLNVTEVKASTRQTSAVEWLEYWTNMANWLSSRLAFLEENLRKVENIDFTF